MAESPLEGAKRIFNEYVKENPSFDPSEWNEICFGIGALMSQLERLKRTCKCDCGCAKQGETGS